MSPSSAGGILMVSSWGDWKYENSTWTNITPADLPANTSSTSIFQDSKGRIWIGTAASGIFSVVDGKTTPYDAGLQVNKIFEVKNGDIYACTNSGLYLYK
jgi:Two component regulator propeller